MARTTTATRPTDEEVVLAGELVTCASRLVRLARRTHQLSAGVRVLSLLDQHGPTGVGALAELDGCSQPTMSTLVRGLADDGFVVKRPHPDDGRAGRAELTEAGRAELVRLRRLNGELVVQRLAGAAAHDPDRDRTELATAVAVLRRLLDPEEVLP